MTGSHWGEYRHCVLSNNYASKLCWFSALSNITAHARRKVTGSLKITHEAWKKTKDKETRRDKVPAESQAQFQAAIKTNDQIELHLNKVWYIVVPLSKRSVYGGHIQPGTYRYGAGSWYRKQWQWLA